MVDWIYFPQSTIFLCVVILDGRTN